MTRSFLPAALAAVALSASPAAAQPVAPPSNLEARVKALEVRVAELERLVAPPSNLTPAVAAPTIYDPPAPGFAPAYAAGSACAGGNCAAPASYRFQPFGGRFRR